MSVCLSVSNTQKHSYQSVSRVDDKAGHSQLEMDPNTEGGQGPDDIGSQAHHSQTFNLFLHFTLLCKSQITYSETHLLNKIITADAEVI